MPSSKAAKLRTILDSRPFLLRPGLVWNHRHSTATAQCCGCTGRRLQGDQKAKRHKQRLQLFEGHFHRHGNFMTIGHFPGCKHYWMCYMHVCCVCLPACTCEQYLSPASIEISWLLFMPIGSALPSRASQVLWGYGQWTAWLTLWKIKPRSIPNLRFILTLESRSSKMIQNVFRSCSKRMRMRSLLRVILEPETI